MTAPYYVAQKQLKESDGNPALLLGNILVLEKLVLNLVNVEDPNSIASQMQTCQGYELLDLEVIQTMIAACLKVKNWTDEYRKAVNFLSQERRTKNGREEKSKLDMVDNVIPIKKETKTSNRFRKLEME